MADGDPGVAAQADTAPQNDVSAPAGSPIQHVVIIIQENSTYDRLDGRLKGSDGLPRGLGDSTLPHDSDPPAVPYAWDPTHGWWWSGRYHEWNDYHGQLDGSDLPLYHEWANEYALCDTSHATLYGPSAWNHASTFAAGMDGWVNNAVSAPLLKKAGRFLRGDPKVGPPFDDPTLPAALDRAGFTWRNYGDGTFQFYTEVMNSPNNQGATQFATDALAGTLPTVSWLHPDFVHTEHAPERVADGMMWVADQVKAIKDGGLWESTAIFILPDDFGGFYDHISAPKLPVPEGGNASDEHRLGPRVPITVLSPYAKAGYLSSERGAVKSFESIVRWTRELLGIPPLDPVSEEREMQVDSMWDCFDFTQSPLPPPRTELLPGELPTAQPASWSLRHLWVDCVAKSEANVRMAAIASRYIGDWPFRFAPAVESFLHQPYGTEPLITIPTPSSPTPTTLQRVAAIASRVVGKAMMAVQHVASTVMYVPVALMWVPAKVVDALAPHTIAPVIRLWNRLLGLDHPGLAKYSHSGWPSNKFGAAVLLAVAVPSLVVAKPMDMMARWGLKHGHTGMMPNPGNAKGAFGAKVIGRVAVALAHPVDPAGLKRRQNFARLLDSNTATGNTPESHEPEPGALAQRPAPPATLPAPRYTYKDLGL